MCLSVLFLNDFNIKRRALKILLRTFTPILVVFFFLLMACTIIPVSKLFHAGSYFSIHFSFSLSWIVIVLVYFIIVVI